MSRFIRETIRTGLDGANSTGARRLTVLREMLQIGAAVCCSCCCPLDANLSDFDSLCGSRAPPESSRGRVRVWPSRTVERVAEPPLLRDSIHPEPSVSRRWISRPIVRICYHRHKCQKWPSKWRRDPIRERKLAQSKLRVSTNDW